MSLVSARSLAALIGPQGPRGPIGPPGTPGIDGGTTIAGKPVSGSPTSGQALVFDGTEWSPSANISSQGDITLTTGLNSNVAIPANTLIRISGPLAPFSIGGFQLTALPGQTIVVQNLTTQPMTIVNEDTSSTAANRIRTPSGSNFLVAPGGSMSISFTYDGIAQRWRVQNAGAPQVFGVNIADFPGIDPTGATDSTAGIQAALDFGGAGGAATRVKLPRGTYKVMVQGNGAALMIRNHAVIFEGEGPSTILQVNGAGAGIVVEPSGSNVGYSRIQNMSMFAGSTPCTDFIILHESNCTVREMYMQGATRFGVLIESGQVGSGNLWGPAISSNGTNLLADQQHVSDVQGFEVGPFNAALTTVTTFTQPSAYGTVVVTPASVAGLVAGMIVAIRPTASLGSPGPASLYSIETVSGSTVTLKWLNNAEGVQAGNSVSGSLQWGALIACHGSDGALNHFHHNNAIDSAVSFIELSQAGSLWTNCYSQEACLGYYAGSVAPSTFDRCGSEDFTLLSASLGNVSTIIGGQLASYVTSTFADTSLQVIGGERAALVFASVSQDGATYGAAIPGGNQTTIGDSLIHLSRAPALPQWESGWNLHYNTSAVFPYTAKSFSLDHYRGLLKDQDPAFGIFGWTDYGNALGGGCFIVNNPTANSSRHWHFKQTVSLTTGQNTVYLNGGSSDAGAIPSGFANPSTQIGIDTPIVNGTTVPANSIPRVYFTGAPTAGSIADLLVFIWNTNSGVFPSGSPPTFAVRVNGSVIATNVAMASSVALTGTAAGITVSFPAGTYDASQSWESQSLWSGSQDDFRCHLEFDNVTDMVAAGLCTVTGVTRVAEGGGGFNLAASVYVGASCTATLVWEFDSFVPNYSSGNVG